jgi:hypothetical protein
VLHLRPQEDLDGVIIDKDHLAVFGHGCRKKRRRRTAPPPFLSLLTVLRW